MAAVWGLDVVRYVINTPSLEPSSDIGSASPHFFVHFTTNTKSHPQRGRHTFIHSHRMIDNSTDDTADQIRLHTYIC